MISEKETAWIVKILFEAKLYIGTIQVAASLKRNFPYALF